MSYNRAITPEENQRNWATQYLKDYVERNGNQIINADGVLRYARRGLYGDRYIWAKGVDILQAARNGELQCKPV